MKHKTLKSTQSNIAKAALMAAFACLLCLSFLLSAAQENRSKTKPQAKLYLAIAEQHERPLTVEKTAFDCQDQIFAVAELSHFPLGGHEFSVRWIDPSNTTREHTRYPFNMRDTSIRLWSWLRLQRGSGASLFQWLDSSAGMEEFIGPWTVEIQVDGKTLDRLTMEVNC